MKKRLVYYVALMVAVVLTACEERPNVSDRVIVKSVTDYFIDDEPLVMNYISDAEGRVTSFRMMRFGEPGVEVFYRGDEVEVQVFAEDSVRKDIYEAEDGRILRLKNDADNQSRWEYDDAGHLLKEVRQLGVGDSERLSVTILEWSGDVPVKMDCQEIIDGEVSQEYGFEFEYYDGKQVNLPTNIDLFHEMQYSSRVACLGLTGVKVGRPLKSVRHIGMDEGVAENFSYEYDEKGRITGVYDGAEDDMERVLWFEIKY